MVFYCIALVISLLYILLLLYIVRGWNDTLEVNESVHSSLKFSILIPVKNEEKNIVACIDSVLINHYPSNAYEIIVVNDHSTDDTLKNLAAINNKALCVHSLVESHGKKQALTCGIQMSKYDYIITLDGDSLVPPYWLSYMASAFHQYNADVVIAPVKIIDGQNSIAQFESYDTAAMMAITANGIIRNQYYLANGANLAFKKESFFSLNGYEDNKHIASGDDVFFVNKAAKAQMKITYLKSNEATVSTYAQPSFSHLMHQRKRWATKTKSYANTTILGIQALVFTISLYSVVALIVGSIFCTCLMISGLIVLIIKMIIDYVFLNKMTAYFNLSHSLSYFLPSFFIYLIMIIYMGIQALWPTPYSWKGQNFEK